MQASGASLFAFFLAQRPESLGIIDLWPRFVAPSLEEIGLDIVLKCVVTTSIPLERHVASFRPDVSILFMRAKSRNLERLSKRGYRDAGGKMEEKFAQFERYQEQPGLFDHVITYEDFLHDPGKVLDALSGLAAPEYYAFPRTKQDLLRFNRAHSAWCRRYYWRRWAFGNIHFERDGRVKLLAGAPGDERAGWVSTLGRRLRGHFSGGGRSHVDSGR